MKHSPGPWLQNGQITQNGKMISVGSSDNGNVALVLTGEVNVGEDSVARANARLIAAAPAMLRVLKDIVDMNGRALDSRLPADRIITMRQLLEAEAAVKDAING